jgi:hypothetical protein
MDPGRVVLSQVRAGKRVTLAAVSQASGKPVYGRFARDRHPRQINLAEGASIGFLGTNIGCAAVRDHSSPGIECLAHSGLGLPGPCCGPNFALLVGSHGFLLSSRRLAELLVVNDGVSTGSGGSPVRVLHEWRR